MACGGVREKFRNVFNTLILLANIARGIWHGLSMARRGSGLIDERAHRRGAHRNEAERLDDECALNLGDQVWAARDRGQDRAH